MKPQMKRKRMIPITSSFQGGCCGATSNLRHHKVSFVLFICISIILVSVGGIGGCGLFVKQVQVQQLLSLIHKTNRGCCLMLRKAFITISINNDFDSQQHVTNSNLIELSYNNNNNNNTSTSNNNLNNDYEDEYEDDVFDSSVLNHNQQQQNQFHYQLKSQQYHHHDHSNSHSLAKKYRKLRSSSTKEEHDVVFVSDTTTTTNNMNSRGIQQHVKNENYNNKGDLFTSIMINGGTNVLKEEIMLKKKKNSSNNNHNNDDHQSGGGGKYPKNDDENQNEIIQYIKNNVHGRDSLVLFIYNTTGHLTYISDIKRLVWLPEKHVQEYYSRTSPSLYGKVALLYNTDAVSLINFTTHPVVPLMVYTAPDSHLQYFNQQDQKENDTDNVNETTTPLLTPTLVVRTITPPLYLLPNPFDLKGGNERIIDGLFEELALLSSPNTFVVQEKEERSSTKKYFLTYEEFHSRKNVIVWRGSVHSDMDPQRVYVCEVSKQLQQDEQRTTTVENSTTTNHTTTDRNNNIGNVVWLDALATNHDKEESIYFTPATMSRTYKYQLDIGGISGTAWGGLRWKMCASGSVVFRIDSHMIDWWHTTLEPYVHYIPVYDNVTNLYEQYMWAENNPDLVYMIAQTGQQKCLESYQEQNASEKQHEIIQNLQPLSSTKLYKDAYEMIEYYSNYFYHE